MKVIGLIGGLSWESSLEYYRIVNEYTKRLAGGFSSSKCLMYSLNFAEVEELQHNDDWKSLDSLMADAANRLYQGGAEIIVLCTNTMHLSSEAIRSAVPIPFLHIAEATGERVLASNLKKVGLLGTKFTMQRDFYKSVLRERYQVETIVPSEEVQETIHKIIYEELVLGQINDRSREIIKKVIEQLQSEGAEGVILGCTELPLLISQKDSVLPVFNTMRIHAEKAVEWAINT